MSTQADKAKPERSRGRPALPVTKVAISIRLDANVIVAFRKTGQGWQTRMNEALCEYARQHDL